MLEVADFSLFSFPSIISILERGFFFSDFMYIFFLDELSIPGYEARISERTSMEGLPVSSKILRLGFILAFFCKADELI